MGIDVNLTRKFIINGKLCSSLDDVPPDVRHAIKTALESPTGPVRLHTKIVFNGCQYDNADAMPSGVHEIYDAAMQCIGSGKGSPAGTSAASPKPIIPQGAFSLSGRWAMVGSLFLCLLVSLLLLILPR